MMVSADHPHDNIATPPTLLVIEDETLIRLDLSDHLRIEGFRVVEAASPKEARAVLDSGAKIDLVLSDIHMPGRDDGIELLRWIGETFPELPIVAASGVPSSLEMARSAAPSIIETVEKPYHAASLAARIRTHLEAAH